MQSLDIIGWLDIIALCNRWVLYVGCKYQLTILLFKQFFLKEMLDAQYELVRTQSLIPETRFYLILGIRYQFSLILGT